MRARLSLFLAGSLALAACQGDVSPSSSAAPGAGSLQENFLTHVPQASLDAGQQGRLERIRSRAGTDEVYMARAAKAPAQLLQRGAAIRMSIAPGVQLVAMGENMQERSADDISWSGPVQGAEGWVQMVVTNGTVTATVTLGRTTYSIEPLGNGLHAVSKIDQNALPPEHSPENPSGSML
jgi:hypothetical protein